MKAIFNIRYPRVSLSVLHWDSHGLYDRWLQLQGFCSHPVKLCGLGGLLQNVTCA